MFQFQSKLDPDLFEAMLRHDEGVRLRVYDDATGEPIGPGSVVKGNPTIGVGRNVGPTGPGLRQDEVDSMLMRDISAYEAQAETFDWYLHLNAVRATVVCAMIFNMGLRTFSTFTGLIAAIGAQDFEKASAEMLASEWAKQVGERATRLAEMMRLGVPIQR